jgi:glycerol-3-phosphate cytidylyltransferase-like family protein
VQDIDINNCDFIAHGDDPVLNPDGSDTYGPFKEAGRFKVIKRTEGISTTDIVGRLLLLSKDKERQPKNIDTPMTTDSYIKNIQLEEEKG